MWQFPRDACASHQSHVNITSKPIRWHISIQNSFSCYSHFQPPTFINIYSTFFAAAAAAHATGLVVAGHASAVVVMPLLMPLKQPSLPLLMFTIIPTNEFLWFSAVYCERPWHPLRGVWCTLWRKERLVRHNSRALARSLFRLAISCLCAGLLPKASERKIYTDTGQKRNTKAFLPPASLGQRWS